MSDDHPLSVAVLLELERGAGSGGHVKCWEHFAEAAASVPEIDLTLYVLGRRRSVEPVAPNVRYVVLRPALSSRPLTRLVGGVDASDLAPYHPGLARELPRHDVWHLTHAMAFTATALRMPARVRRPLVASLHTDVPSLTRAYTQQVLADLPARVGQGLRWTRVDRVPVVRARRRQERMLRAADHVLVSNSADQAEVAALVPATRVSHLRRGVDCSLFRPPPDGERHWLTDRHGVPEDRPRVLFVGRVDATKGALLLAEAVRRARTSGQPVHLVVAGDGADSARVARLLGSDVTLLGKVPQADLARVYAECDVLGFPSRSETAGNVVGEAMAAGLPVVLPRDSRTCRWLAAPGEDGLLVDRDDPDAWASALVTVLGDRRRRAAMGRRARATIESVHPTWSDVFEEDLLGVWAAAARRAVPVRATAAASA